MNPFDFPLQFLRPWWWLALLPLPLAMWAVLRSGGLAALTRLADARLLPHLVRGGGERKRLALGLFALAWLLAVAAMAGPAWQKVATPLYVNGAARVVALSLSDDMLARDLKPDRMTHARFAVRDLLDDAGDAETALVAYAGAAFTVAPLTNDKRTVLNLLRVLRPNVMPVPGNDAGAGIDQSVRLLEQAHVRGGEIVLVTDTAGQAAVAAARKAHDHGIRVDVLGIGTAAGAPVPRAGGGFANGAGGLRMARLDSGALRAVADAGGGRYVALAADGQGAAAFGTPVAEAAHANHGQRAELWRDGGIWLLPALLLLGALAFRRGWLLVIAFCVLPLGMPAAHAATWQSLWSNRNQRALEALERGHDRRAQQLATTPGVRGAAEYREGDYAKAARSFAHGRDARSRYNLGNALAKQGEYSQAIDAYRQALKQDPKFADARANLDSVENWMKRHPLPQQGSQRSGSSGRSGQQPQSGTGTPQQGRAGQSSRQSGSGTSQSRSGANGTAPNSRARAQGGNGNTTQSGGGGSSPGEAARQQRETRRAERGLARELEQQGQSPKRSGQAPGAFALGRNEARSHRGFDASQRAMLRAVKDAPGAFLRRKFRLEWEQRQGRQPGGIRP